MNEKYNPPFSNRTISDFFDFVTDNQDRAIYTKNWIEETFPDLEIGLSSKLPTYSMGKKKIFYLKYLWLEGEFQLEMTFLRGHEMKDSYEIFQEKGARVKSVLIDNLSEELFHKLKKYIEEAMSLEGFLA